MILESLGIFAAAGVLGTGVSSYRKVGPNEVLVITGGFLKGPFVQENPETHSKVKIVKGGGSFVWPMQLIGDGKNVVVKKRPKLYIKLMPKGYKKILFWEGKNNVESILGDYKNSSSWVCIPQKK